MQQSTARLAGIIFLFSLLVFGCVSNEVAVVPPPTQAVVLVSGVSPPEASGKRSGISKTCSAAEVSSAQAPAPEDLAVALGGKGRATAECFHLHQGSAGSKKGKGGRCEPQSLPFARCRSGIATCRLGYENGPLTWFACEKKRGNTSPLPQNGSVLILAANARRGMPTGHVAYVEEAVALDDGRYRLIFSHTNYDRKCSLETNIKATYDSAAHTLDIQGGAWGAWGKGLAVAGFILE